MSKATDIADWGQYQPVRKNLIINGGMNVAQRGTTFTAASGFTLDRWEIGNVGTMVVDISQQTNATAPALLSSYLYYEVTTADVTIATTALSLIAQHIEGYNIVPLGWHLTEQSDKKDVTLSFWHKHTKTGTNCVSLRNADVTRSYVVEYTQTVSDTWEYESITIPAPTDGTWEVDNSSGIQILFGAAVGATYQAAKDTWHTGNYLATSSQINNVDDTANKMRFTGIQLEVGDTATEFENRMFAEELALCQRYFEKSYNYDTAPGTVTTNGFVHFVLSGLSTAVHLLRQRVKFSVTKRNTPTITLYSNSTGATGKLRDNIPTANDITGFADGIGTDGFRYYGTGKSSNYVDLSCHWTADAEL